MFLKKLIFMDSKKWTLKWTLMHNFIFNLKVFQTIQMGIKLKSSAEFKFSLKSLEVKWFYFIFNIMQDFQNKSLKFEVCSYFVWIKILNKALKYVSFNAKYS
jgi:hypothetical protein